MTPGGGEGGHHRCIRVGRITRAHGLHGEVKIQAYGGDPRELQRYTDLLLSPAGAEYGIRSYVEARPVDFENYAVTGTRLQGDVALVTLDRVRDRSAAEALQGREVWVDAAQLAAAAEDEFYWHEVEGMAVVTENGDPVGRVHTLFTTPAHDVLVVRNRGEEYYIPASREFVVAIDRQRRLLTVAAVDGLLDINRRGR
ncbi:MAG: ribosome maturation factor RimM [Thermodesulfobacteriota bacterium]